MGALSRELIKASEVKHNWPVICTGCPMAIDFLV
jgi:hypothetical protein